VIQHWELLGLRTFVRERKRHRTFVGHWMGDPRPDIRAVSSDDPLGFVMLLPFVASPLMESNSSYL
jgi:hypothetical protein